MKTRTTALFAILLSSMFAWAQASTSPAPAPSRHRMRPKMTIMHRGEMGKWWQNSDVAKKLQLSDSQISQLDQTFFDHKMKLIDYGAAMEKQDLKLQNLLDADVPNEGQVEAQVDQVLAARGKLEREFTMMNLDLRKVLTLQQWRQLKSMQGGRGEFGNRVFFHKTLPPGGPDGPNTLPVPPGAPPAPPAPDSGPDEMF